MTFIGSIVYHLAAFTFFLAIFVGLIMLIIKFLKKGGFFFNLLAIIISVAIIYSIIFLRVYIFLVIIYGPLGPFLAGNNLSSF